MTTSALTLSDFSVKFSAIRAFVTPEILSVINNSETMKGMIRTYEANPRTQDVLIDLSPDGIAAATYSSPGRNRAGIEVNGVATFGIYRINTTQDFLYAVSHELGHAGVEGPGLVVTNSRNKAYIERDVDAYESACHMSEGYARLATVKVYEEIIANTSIGNDPQIASLIGRLATTDIYKQYTDVLPLVTGTAAQKDNTMARALAESNKLNKTSTELIEYVEFCRKSAEETINHGAIPPIFPAPEPAKFTNDSDTGTTSVTQTDSDGDVLNSNTETDTQNKTYFRADDADGKDLTSTKVDADADGIFDSMMIEIGTPGQASTSTWTVNLGAAVITPNTITGDQAQPDRFDVLYGSAAGDDITGLDGNDALNGAAGTDKISGGVGDDLIGGGAGSDVINGGAGNDWIFSALNLNAPARTGPSDVWPPIGQPLPPTATIIIQGKTWGVYYDIVNGKPVTYVNGVAVSTPDIAADVIDGGDGDDKLAGKDLSARGSAMMDTGIKGLMEPFTDPQRPECRMLYNPNSQKFESRCARSGFTRRARRPRDVVLQLGVEGAS
jgi:RTX calcium-binding nonapeptide repeat (4 copies)